MMFRTVLASLIVAGFVLPAAAQSFYVVQDVKTKKCQIVQTRPTTKEMTIVGPEGVTYKSRTEAADAMKTVKVCHTE